MKIDLIIKDASPDEAISILSLMGTNAINPNRVELQPLPMATFSTAPQPIEENDEPEVASDGSGVDIKGLPWDERIHAGTKTVNKDGTWKKRKGVQEMEVTQVEAELRARMSAPAMPAAPTFPQPVPVAQTFPTVDPNAFPAMAAMVGVQTTPLAAPVSSFEQVPPHVHPTPMPAAPTFPQPVPAMDTSYQGLMNTVSSLYTQKVIDDNYLHQLVNSLGVSSVTDIQNDPARIAQAFNTLKSHGKIA